MSKTAYGFSRRALFLAAAGLGLCRVATAKAAARLTVFAAASLKEAIDDITAAYRAANGVEAQVSYAASSQLARQIAAGAPADLFISADLEWMDWLEKEGHIVNETRRTLLGNSLVLVSAADAVTPQIALQKGFDLSALIGGARMVIAEPSSVPAGRYAKQSLEALGMWEAVEKKLAFAANVRATLALVARGEAPYGIVYSTDAAAEPKVKVVGRFPEDSHTPILYPVAKTKQAGPDADAFLAYLSGPAAKPLFEQHGFRYLLDGKA